MMYMEQHYAYAGLSTGDDLDVKISCKDFRNENSTDDILQLYGNGTL